MKIKLINNLTHAELIVDNTEELGNAVMSADDCVAMFATSLVGVVMQKNLDLYGVLHSSLESCVLQQEQDGTVFIVNVFKLED